MVNDIFIGKFKYGVSSFHDVLEVARARGGRVAFDSCDYFARS